MASAVPGDGSSSPSGNQTLTLLAMRRRGTAGEQLHLELSDGSSFFVSERQLAEEGIELAAGMHLPEALVVRLRELAQAWQARRKALVLLAAAPHSVFSLRAKLLKRGFAERAVEQTLGRLAELGLLDDRRYAAEWVHSRLERHPEGRVSLVAGLRRHGVQRHLAEEVVAAMTDAETEQQSARRLLARLERRAPMPEQVLRRRLRARGFSLPVIRAVLGDRPRDEDQER
jgi:SOS response regulatory protein OraA/RecX